MRIVLEVEVRKGPQDEDNAVHDRYKEAFEWIHRRMQDLATGTPRYLVEQDVWTEVGRVQADGSIPYRIRAVMNTEKGQRLLPAR